MRILPVTLLSVLRKGAAAIRDFDPFPEQVARSIFSSYSIEIYNRNADAIAAGCSVQRY